MSALQALLNDPNSAWRWQLVPARSSVRFKNKTFWGLATVTGEFTEVRGAGEVTANGALSGELVIGAASLKTGISKRDEHLRSADFFDVENHPVIRVEVTGVESSGNLRATLTVRGTTEPLPLPVTVQLLDDGTVQLTARAAIDRTEWGVSGNMVGMMPATTTLLADVVFAKAG